MNQGNMAARIEKTIEILSADVLENINLINFLENNPITGIEYIDDSLLVRGVSDRSWTFISCSSESELTGIMKRLGAQDTCFAAVEDWMLPVLLKDRELLWKLSVTQYYLPPAVGLSAPVHRTENLTGKDAGTVYENSDYREFISVEYIEDRIRRGISRGIREEDRLAGWGLTHDDGGLGFLHVLETARRKGYGLSIVVSLVEEVRRTGKIPFTYIEPANQKSINLVSKLGFVVHKNRNWLRIR